MLKTGIAARSQRWKVVQNGKSKFMFNQQGGRVGRIQEPIMDIPPASTKYA